MPKQTGIVEHFKRFDIFGREITLTYKGRFFNKSVIGALLTLVIGIFLCTYSIGGLTAVIKGDT